jgi:hypothetical protein
MSKFDLSEFTRLLNAAGEQYREQAILLRQGAASYESQRVKNRRAVAQLLLPLLGKAGLDQDKFNKLLAHNQEALRRNFNEQKISAARHSASQAGAFSRATELGYMALEHLGNRAPLEGSGLSSLIALTTPFLIWEWPRPDPEQLRDSHIQALNSWAKILVDITAYAFDNDEGADSKEFSFYFLWRNESPGLAVAKVFSVLSLTGACEAWANSGVFSGDKMNLNVQASLYPITYWLPLQPGQTINNLRVIGDPLQTQNVLTLDAYGGDWFDDSSDSGVPKLFNSKSIGMSFASGALGGFAIPGNTTALFEVSLRISWDWHGNTLPDEIIADFSDDKLNHKVVCPIVVLQLLTTPPAAA